jgi:hypothetical protein
MQYSTISGVVVDADGTHDLTVVVPTVWSDDVGGGRHVLRYETVWLGLIAARRLFPGCEWLDDAVTVHPATAAESAWASEQRVNTHLGGPD